MSKISKVEIKRIRTIGAGLQPAVTIGERGLTPEVIKEADGRLKDHELIKVRSHIKDRITNASLFGQACEQLDAQLIQVIGKTALVMRLATGDKPKHSNL